MSSLKISSKNIKMLKGNFINMEPVMDIEKISDFR